MDWNAFWTAFFGAIVVALPTILTILATWWNHSSATKDNGTKIDDLSQRMDKLKP